jgi:hypothetical protein
MGRLATTENDRQVISRRIGMLRLPGIEAEVRITTVKNRNFILLMVLCVGCTAVQRRALADVSIRAKSGVLADALPQDIPALRALEPNGFALLFKPLLLVSFGDAAIGSMYQLPDKRLAKTVGFSRSQSLQSQHVRWQI